MYMQMLEYEIKQHPRNASYDLVAQFGPKNYIQYKRWCDSRGYEPDAHQRLYPLTQDEVEDETDAIQAHKLLKILHPTDGLYLKKKLAQYLSPLWGAWKHGYEMDNEYGGRIPFGKKHPIWVITDEFPENYFLAAHWQEEYDTAEEEEWADFLSFSKTGGIPTPQEFREGIESAWEYDEWPEYYDEAIRLNPTSITLSVTEELDGDEWEHKEYLKLHGIERLSDILSYVCWDWIDMKEENPYLYNAKIIYDALGYNPTLQRPQEWKHTGGCCGGNYEEIIFFPTRKMPAETLKQLRRAAHAEVKDIMAKL